MDKSQSLCLPSTIQVSIRHHHVKDSSPGHLLRIAASILNKKKPSYTPRLGLAPSESPHVDKSSLQRLRVVVSPRWNGGSKNQGESASALVLRWGWKDPWGVSRGAIRTH